jgi:hypothetical protein
MNKQFKIGILEFGGMCFVLGALLALMVVVG